MSTAVPVITLDGPGGAGKGTLASALARELGWRLLDSGALYRLVGLVALRDQLDVDNADDCRAAAAAARSLDLAFTPDIGAGQGVRLAGKDVSADIRSNAVSEAASKWAVQPAIRRALLARQRDFAVAPGLIADGRDMGTVVFPAAELKLYVTASAGERARRRFNQLSAAGLDATLTMIYEDILARDARDKARVASPLMPADDAHVIDTTGDNVASSLERVRSLVKAQGWRSHQP